MAPRMIRSFNEAPLPLPPPGGPEPSAESASFPSGAAASAHHPQEMEVRKERWVLVRSWNSVIASDQHPDWVFPASSGRFRVRASQSQTDRSSLPQPDRFATHKWVCHVLEAV